MTREELISSREYWIAKIQMDLFNQLESYMVEHNLTRTQLAEKLGVTKGYISQILNGDFDHKLSKLVDLALLMGKIPQIDYPDLHEFISEEGYNENASQYVFKAIIRGNQLQDLSYLSNEDNGHNHNSKLMNA